MKHLETKTSRRRFIEAGGLTLATAAMLPHISVKQAKATAPSERITVGVIGLGSRGFNLIDDLLANSHAQIVIICDVNALHYRDRPWGEGTAFGRQATREKIEARDPTTKGLAVTDDYREVCRRGEHRRGGRRHARSLACAVYVASTAERQGRLLRKTADTHLPRGAACLSRS